MSWMVRTMAFRCSNAPDGLVSRCSKSRAPPSQIGPASRSNRGRAGQVETGADHRALEVTPVPCNPTSARYLEAVSFWLTLWSVAGILLVRSDSSPEYRS